MNPDELRSFRKRKGLTQAGLADVWKISKRTVVAWENGQNPVPAWVEDKINEDGRKLNPKLTFDVFQRAQEMALQEGLNFDDWVAALITAKATAPNSRPAPSSVKE